MTWDPFTKPKMIAAPGRTVRNLTDDDDDSDDDLPKSAPTRRTLSEAIIRPIVAEDAEGNLRSTHLRKKEPKMPKGIYERKPRESKAAIAETAAPQPRKQARKARALAVVPKVSPPKLNGAAGRFEVSLDLRAGAVVIHAANGSLALASDEVAAFLAFLGRRPASV